MSKDKMLVGQPPVTDARVLGNTKDAAFRAAAYVCHVWRNDSCPSAYRA